jgi:rare lipoprotein A
VVVTINDRGPFARGRVIDVSRRAARKLDFVRDGTARVRLEILEN